jgi:hypothetical protein
MLPSFWPWVKLEQNVGGRQFLPNDASARTFVARFLYDQDYSEFNHSEGILTGLKARTTGILFRAALIDALRTNNGTDAARIDSALDDIDLGDRRKTYEKRTASGHVADYAAIIQLLEGSDLYY